MTLVKLKWILPLVIVLAAFAAIACGGDSNEEEPGETSAMSTSADPTPVPAEPTSAPASSVEQQAASSEPPAGGIFRRQWADPPTLDPHLTTDTTSSFVVVELYSGLVTLNTKLELVPDIAERWEISDDGLQYTFYLRPNAKFHDGRQVTAQDFKWSIERAAAPETASPVADTYLNDIVGALDYIKGNATEISGIRVVDDSTLSISVDAPKAYFLAKLTYPTAFVLDRANVEAGGRSWTDNPNGTGPFRLKEYKIGERIVLERNEHYYREPAKVDSILLNLAGGQSMAMYENDEIDITGVSLFDLERVLDPNEPLNEELIVAPPDFSISYIGFNASMPPFDDPKFRQALNHAIDKELIASEVLSDLVVPAFGILPPGFPGYNNRTGGAAARQGARPAATERVQVRRPRYEAAYRHYGARHGRHDRLGPRGSDRDVAPGAGSGGRDPAGGVGDLSRGPQRLQVPGLRRSGLAGGLSRPAGLPGHSFPHRQHSQPRRVLQPGAGRHS